MKTENHLQSVETAVSHRHYHQQQGMEMIFCLNSTAEHHHASTEQQVLSS